MPTEIKDSDRLKGNWYAWHDPVWLVGSLPKKTEAGKQMYRTENALFVPLIEKNEMLEVELPAELSTIINKFKNPTDRVRNLALEIPKIWTKWVR